MEFETIEVSVDGPRGAVAVFGQRHPSAQAHADIAAHEVGRRDDVAVADNKIEIGHLA